MKRKKSIPMVNRILIEVMRGFNKTGVLKLRISIITMVSFKICFISVCNNFTKNSAGDEIDVEAFSDDGLADLAISFSTIDLTMDEEMDLDFVEGKFIFKIIIV
jgi:hypothetical protein